jgi:tetratricopeptide (TPR) repeat protein
VFRGYWSESQRWLEDALALSEREQSKKAEAGNYIPTHTEKAQRAKALFGVTWPQLTALNLSNAHKTVAESLRLWRELGDKWWTAVALEHIGFILTLECDVRTSRACLEEGVSLAREVEDPWPLVVCLNRLGEHLKATDMVRAHQILEEGVAMARHVGDKSVLSYGLRELSAVYLAEGNFTAAVRVTEEALTDAREIGSIFNVLAALFQLVVISCLQNDSTKAKGYCFELWALARDTGVGLWAGLALTAFGLAALFGGESQRGVQLFGALEAALGQHGINFPEGDPTTMIIGRALEKARAQLGPEVFAAAQYEGHAMTMEQALAVAAETEGEE